MLSPFIERFGGQSPKVLASTKGARVIFYGTSRRLLTKGVCLHGPGDCPPHPLLVIYTLFDGPAKQLSLCVFGWWVGGSIDALNPSLGRSWHAVDCHRRRCRRPRQRRDPDVVVRQQ